MGTIKANECRLVDIRDSNSMDSMRSISNKQDVLIQDNKGRHLRGWTRGGRLRTKVQEEDILLSDLPKEVRGRP